MRTDKHLADVEPLTEEEYLAHQNPPTDEAEERASRQVWERARALRLAKQKLAGEVIASTDEEEREIRKSAGRSRMKRYPFL